MCKAGKCSENVIIGKIFVIKCGKEIKKFAVKKNWAVGHVKCRPKAHTTYGICQKKRAERRNKYKINFVK